MQYFVGRHVPDPVQALRTGTLDVAGHAVEVDNGTPQLQRLPGWGLDRLDAAGLGAPDVERVTFYPDHVDRCEGIVGLTEQHAITLCMSMSTACQDQACTSWRKWSRATLLHELGHAWMQDNAARDTIGAFLIHANPSTWVGAKAAWNQRRAELAAETFAWALMDGRYRIRRQLQPRTCDELADLFKILTGEPPDPMPQCAESRASRGRRTASRAGARDCCGPTQPAASAGGSGPTRIDPAVPDEHREEQDEGGRDDPKPRPGPAVLVQRIGPPPERRDRGHDQDDRDRRGRDEVVGALLGRELVPA